MVKRNKDGSCPHGSVFHEETKRCRKISPQKKVGERKKRSPKNPNKLSKACFNCHEMPIFEVAFIFDGLVNMGEQEMILNNLTKILRDRGDMRDLVFREDKGLNLENLTLSDAFGILNYMSMMMYKVHKFRSEIAGGSYNLKYGHS